MFEIRVSSEFSSAHSLRGYRGKCEELHGHNWKIEVSVSAKELNKSGMVMDFKELRSRLNNVIAKLDHKHLNELSYFKKVNPTSENIAKYIFNELAVGKLAYTIDKVTVWESENSCASYSLK